MDLAKLREMRKNSTKNLAQLAEAIEKQNQRSDYNDERFWKVDGDKAGNGSAVIRFLKHEDDELPFVKVYSHGFQGPTGKWYIENCRTTINEADPVVEHTSVLWNSGLESDKELARKRKRKLAYISNILVVNDPKHPENNGKVFLFKYGKKIFDKISDKLTPSFEDQEPLDIFNPWEGANFRLRMRRVDDFANFEQSEWDAPSAISDDDEKLLEILNSTHRLAEFTDPKNFKSYDELKKRLDSVLSGANGPSAEKINLEEKAGVNDTLVDSVNLGDGNLIADDVDDVDLKYFEDMVK